MWAVAALLLLAAATRAQQSPSLEPADPNNNLSLTAAASVTAPARPTSSLTWTGADGSYVSSVLSCQSLKDAWKTASSSWLTASHSSYSYSTYTLYDTQWLGNYSGPLSTLCDGVPRATGSAPLITTPSSSIVQTDAPPFPTPEPSCTYNYRGCELLISSYRDAYTSASAAQQTDTLQALTPPSCWNDPSQCITPAGEDGCRLDAGDVKLIYWATSKPASALCTSPNALLPTPSTSPTPTTITSGPYTFVSPTIYLSFATLYGLPCYTTWPSALIPLPTSTLLSSIAFAGPTTTPIYTTRPLHWPDLASPVPASAYSAQMSCQPNWGGVRADGCSTIYDDYLPWLALPTDPALFVALDARFGNCSRVFWRKYVFDPPLALTGAQDLVPQTTTTTESARVAYTSVAPAAQRSPEVRSPVAAVTIAEGVVVEVDPANPRDVLVGTETLVPGQVTVVAGRPVVVATGAVVVGGETVRLATGGAGETGVRGAVVTVGSGTGAAVVTASANAATSGGVVVVAGKTLTVGGDGAVVAGVSVSAVATGVVIEHDFARCVVGFDVDAGGRVERDRDGDKDWWGCGFERWMRKDESIDLEFARFGSVVGLKEVTAWI
ncbi:Transcription factor c6 [Neofusicoccum parvum]|nr:Transcription factor c6 [Neofusicoccum parvum]